jgi:hypothetical protein
VTAPINGVTVSGASINVSATATDNAGVSGVQFYLDGTATSNKLGAEDTSSPYSITWNTTTASNGSHALRAIARDAAGNTTVSTSITVTVNNAAPDTIPPNTTITATPGSATTATTASFSFTSSESNSTFECKLDTGSFTSCSSPKTYAGLSVASHTFSVRAIDSSNNTDATPASYTWSITSPPAASGSTSAPSTAAPTPASKLGDLNGDNKVDLKDLSILLGRYNSTNAQADINKDSRVDLKDLSILLSRYGS